MVRNMIVCLCFEFVIASCAAGSAAPSQGGGIRDAGAGDQSGMDDGGGVPEEDAGLRYDPRAGGPDPSQDLARVDRAAPSRPKEGDSPPEDPPADDPQPADDPPPPHDPADDEFPPEDEPPAPPEDPDRDHDGVRNEDDCAPDDPFRYPGMMELCDLRDNDCNGFVDDGFGTTTCGRGACERTVENCFRGALRVCGGGLPEPEVCGNGIDENCDGEDEVCPLPDPPPADDPPPDHDRDHDGVGNVDDCAPDDPLRFPGMIELCDGTDNDCDGAIDEEFWVQRCGIGMCTRIVPVCADGRLQACVPGDPSPEVCDGRDNDCDWIADEDLPVVECGVGACRRGQPSCMDGLPHACEPGAPSLEICGNGYDEDCDGSDLACPPPPPPPPPRCYPFVARSPAPWLLDLTPHFLCEHACTAFVGEAYRGDGHFPWSWLRGPVARVNGAGVYTYSLRGYDPGTYRVSYIIPQEGCDAVWGSAAPGSVCEEGGPWAAYRDGAEVCPEYRNWVWCGDPGDGYTCSLMFRLAADGTITPAGNR